MMSGATCGLLTWGQQPFTPPRGNRKSSSPSSGFIVAQLPIHRSPTAGWPKGACRLRVDKIEIDRVST